MKDKEKLRKLKKNLKLYYTYRVFCTMNFVMPIFMLFLIDKGLTTFQVFVTQAAYTLMEMLLTVPSGAFADKVGRKKTLILSTVTYAAAFGIYGFADSFTQVLLAEMVFAVASASFHGTGEAFLYDTLSEAKQQKRYKKSLGTAYAIQSVVMGLSAVAGGYMAKHDLALPFFLSALPVALSMIPLFFLDEPKRTNKCEDSYWKLMKDASLFVARHKRLRNVMYFISITSVAGFVSWMLLQPMLTKMGMGLEFLGFTMMALSVAHGIGNKLAHRFEQAFRKFDLMFVFAGVKSLLYMLVYLASSYYLLVWMLIRDFVAGIGSPIVSEWINRDSKEENRATVLSLSGMAGCLSFSLFSPLVGLFVDAYNEQLVYLLLAMVLATYALRQLVVMLIARRYRRSQ
ncbi:MFS transporter [Nanoarchaeota archaeon]